MTRIDEVLITQILETVRERRRKARMREEVDTQTLEGLAEAVEAPAAPDGGRDKIKMRVAR